MAYFENVSIKRTAHCSSSLHYPAAGRMPKTHIAHIGDDVCKVVTVEMERHLTSEADDNLARDPLSYRSAWLFGSYACVNAGNRDDRKTCSSKLVQ